MTMVSPSASPKTALAPQGKTRPSEPDGFVAVAIRASTRLFRAAPHTPSTRSILRSSSGLLARGNPSLLGIPSLQAWVSQPQHTAGVLTPGVCLLRGWTDLAPKSSLQLHRVALHQPRCARHKLLHPHAPLD